MAAKQSETAKQISLFLKELAKSITLEKVYLFGSHAAGTAKAGSDIDLVVISQGFASMKPFDRLVFLGKVAWRAGTPEVETVGYTPEEFFSAPPWEFASDVRQKGKAIHF